MFAIHQILHNALLLDCSIEVFTAVLEHINGFILADYCTFN